MIPRHGRPPVPGQRYQRRPGAYAILPRGRHLLLTFQERPVPEFQLPGGGVDPGEGLVEALRREVLEETGWRVGAMTRVGAYRNFTFMPEYDIWAEKVCTVFVGQPLCRVSAPSEAGHSAHFVDVTDAHSMLGPVGDRRMLTLAASLGLVANTRTTRSTRRRGNPRF